MKNQNLEVLKDYLNSKTSYFLILSGNYGIGKTHFLKKIAIPEISKAYNPISGNNFKPIHISLFGVKSLENLQAQIILSILPIKKRASENTLAVLKPMSRIGLSYLGVKGFDAIESGLRGLLTKVTAPYKDLVLILDDVDRKQDELDIKELFGFVNNLVENEGVKAILVAEESTLASNENELEWSKIIEKTSVRIRFKSNTSLAIENLVHQLGDETYQVFIRSNIEAVKKICEGNGSNLRNLQYALDKCNNVFYNLLEIFKSDKEFERLKEKLLERILVFIYAISIEYREGRISSHNMAEVMQEMSSSYFDHNLLMDMFDSNISGPVEEKQTANKTFSKEAFMGSYYKDTEFVYDFNEAILFYVVNYDVLNLSKLEAEVSKALFELGELNKPEYKLMEQLYYPNVWSLSDKEYVEKTKQILDNCRDGKYDLKHVYYTFNFVLRFDNPLNWPPDELRKELISSTNKSINHQSFDRNLGMNIFDIQDYLEESRSLQQDLLEINKSIKDAKDSKVLDTLWSYFIDNTTAFIEELESRNSSNFDRPFLNNFAPKESFEHIRKGKQENILAFCEALMERYTHTHINKGLELKFLTGFKMMLESSLEKDDNGIMLKSILAESLKKINAILGQAEA